MLAAPAAIPPNPKIAAIIANITNVTVQRNIVCVFKVNIMGQYSLPFIQMSKYFPILLCGIQKRNIPSLYDLYSGRNYTPFNKSSSVICLPELNQ